MRIMMPGGSFRYLAVHSKKHSHGLGRAILALEKKNVSPLLVKLQRRLSCQQHREDFLP